MCELINNILLLPQKISLSIYPDLFIYHVCTRGNWN